MKSFISYILLTLVSTYNLINTEVIFTNRPIYISGQISEDQRDIITKTVETYNKPQCDINICGLLYPHLYIINDKFVDKTQIIKNHIRIQYSPDPRMGYTELGAILMSDGYLYITNSTISFNSKLNGNSLGCVILHELGHTQGLMHSQESGSIMNYTGYKDELGNILESPECTLSLDDIIGLISFYSGKYIY